jgi:hypothetical protein
MLLIDREQKALYRYKMKKLGQKDGESMDMYPLYSMDKTGGEEKTGLAGYVAISCHTLMTDNIKNEGRFV